jgi:hypothetical protein
LLKTATGAPALNTPARAATGRATLLARLLFLFLPRPPCAARRWLVSGTTTVVRRTIVAFGAGAVIIAAWSVAIIARRAAIPAFAAFARTTRATFAIATFPTWRAAVVPAAIVTAWSAIVATFAALARTTRATFAIATFPTWRAAVVPTAIVAVATGRSISAIAAISAGALAPVAIWTIRTAGATFPIPALTTRRAIIIIPAIVITIATIIAARRAIVIPATIVVPATVVTARGTTIVATAVVAARCAIVVPATFAVTARGTTIVATAVVTSITVATIWRVIALRRALVIKTNSALLARLIGA